MAAKVWEEVEHYVFRCYKQLSQIMFFYSTTPNPDNNGGKRGKQVHMGKNVATKLFASHPSYDAQIAVCAYWDHL